MMMSTTMKQMKFNVLSAENGYEAYNHVCKFIEDYNKCLTVTPALGMATLKSTTHSLAKITITTALQTAILAFRCFSTRVITVNQVA